MAILSPNGVGVRALVSRWLARVEDVEEEKDTFQQRSQALVTQLAPYAARAAKNPGGTSATMISSLGPSVLGDLRADSDIVNGVVLRVTIQRVYLDNLEGLRLILDSVAAVVGPQ
jgi:hypothetical protein